MSRGKGWFDNPVKHSLASKGLKTSFDFNNSKNDLDMNKLKRNVKNIVEKELEDKNIQTPEIILVSNDEIKRENETYGNLGQYLPEWQKMVDMDSERLHKLYERYSGNTPAILLNEDIIQHRWDINDSEEWKKDVLFALLHELKHHIQYARGIDYDYYQSNKMKLEGYANDFARERMEEYL